MSFATFLAELPELRPKAASESIRSFVLPNREPSALATLIPQVAAARAQGKLAASNYSLIVTIAQNVPWSIQILQSHTEPIILGAAVDVLAAALIRNTNDTLAQLGGIEGLISIVGDNLSHVTVNRLFKVLSTKRTPPPALLAVNDALLAATFSFIEPTSAKPLERLAPCMTGSLILSCSPAVLKQILPRLARLTTESQWAKLVERYPDEIAELVMIQLDVQPSTNDWANNGALETPSWLKSCVPLLLKSDKNASFGRQFFAKFVPAYAAKLQRGRPADGTQDVLGATSARVTVIDSHVEYYLESIVDRQERTEAALAILEQFIVIRRLEGNYYQHKRLLWVLVDLFAKRPDLWESSLQHLVPRDDPILRGICECIENIGAASVNINSVDSWFRFSRQPRGARFPLLHIAFSVTNIPLTVAPSAEDAKRFPSIPISLLSILAPRHARILSRIGSEAKGSNQFFTIGSTSSKTQASKAINSAIYIVNSIEAARQPDARFAVLRASWVGAQRGPAGDAAPASEQGDGDGVADVDNDIEAYLKLSYRSPEATGREVYAKLALSLCILLQSPRRFTDTLAAVLQRYAKDPVVGPNLFQWVIRHDEGVNFLAAPAGLYLTKTSAARCGVTSETLSLWVTTSSEIIHLLLKVIKTWLFTPGFTGVNQYGLLGNTLTSILGRCVCC